MGASLVVLAIILLLPSPPPLERGGELIPLSWHGKAMLGILVTAIVLWITEVTSLQHHRHPLHAPHPRSWNRTLFRRGTNGLR